MNVSFLYLNAFSAVGGIQKFNQNFLHACSKVAGETNTTTVSYALADKKGDLNSFENIRQDSAEGNKMKFLMHSFFQGRGADKIIFGHFNLLFPLAPLFRVFFPKTEIILIAHGIEAWRPLPFHKRICLGCCHTILAVSHFTKEKIISVHGFPANRIRLFPNTLASSFTRLLPTSKPAALLQKHGLDGTEKIIFTLCRLSSAEKQKGYENVIRVLPGIVANHPSVRYVLAGKEEDTTEKKRLVALIEELHLEKHVIFPGYLLEEEVPAYYALCDVFVMPSVKEGFGIVFLEALAAGKQVVAGNVDGSRDALLNGELGTLVNPSDDKELQQAICGGLGKSADEACAEAGYRKQKAEAAFGFETFLERTKSLFLNPRLNRQKRAKKTAPASL